jgi:hypothetical protein
MLDERAKGSDPRSDFEVGPIEDLEVLELNGQPVWAIQNPWKETRNEKKDERKNRKEERTMEK